MDEDDVDCNLERVYFIKNKILNECDTLQMRVYMSELVDIVSDLQKQVKELEKDLSRFDY